MVVNKPAGIVVFPEGQTKNGTLIEKLTENYPSLKNVGEMPRYGIVHRLDKDTSGILLVAKSTETLIFLQKEFINRRVEKKYTCLVEGVINDDSGALNTLIARSSRDPRKQTVFEKSDPDAPQSAREAITGYKVLERFKDYTLLEVEIKTGRRHQIRCHFSYLQHPVVGDKLYRFKNSKTPDGLIRQFLHASYIKIQLPFDTARGKPNGKTEEFKSDLPEELKSVIKKLEK